MPLRPEAAQQGYNYEEAMFCISQAALPKAGLSSTAAPLDYNRVLNDLHGLEDIISRSELRLQSKANCKTMQHRLEYYALRLTSSYAMSVMSRPALSSDATSSPERDVMAEKCKIYLTETVQAFLNLQSLSIFATRAWAVIHNGLSSALLLGILGETKTNPRVRKLQGELLDVLSRVSDDEGEVQKMNMSQRDFELSRPHSKALLALQRIYDHGSLWPSAPSRNQPENLKQDVSSPAQNDLSLRPVNPDMSPPDLDTKTGTAPRDVAAGPLAVT